MQLKGELKMKRVFLCLLIISMIVVFSLAGCKSEVAEAAAEIEEVEETSAEEAAEESEEESSEEVTDEDREEKPHFTSDDGKIEFSLDNVERTKVLPDEIVKWVDRDTPKEGYDFIVIDLTIARITDGHVYFGSSCFRFEENSTLVDNGGAEFVCSLGTWQIILHDVHNFEESGTESPEGTQGTIVFEIPENAQPVKVKLAYMFFESWSESGQYQSEEERYIDIILY